MSGDNENESCYISSLVLAHKLTTAFAPSMTLIVCPLTLNNNCCFFCSPTLINQHDEEKLRQAYCSKYTYRYIFKAGKTKRSTSANLLSVRFIILLKCGSIN